MKLKKCFSCKAEIPEDLLFLQPKHDRSGNIKYTKSGRIDCYYYHKDCYDIKEKNKIEWELLYEYIKAKYYHRDLPPILIIQLKSLRKNFTFREMYECMISLEEKITKRFNAFDFNDEFHKVNFIYYMLSNNIDGYTYKMKVTQANMANIELINFDSSPSNLVKVTESEDYDFLD